MRAHDSAEQVDRLGNLLAADPVDVLDQEDRASLHLALADRVDELSEGTPPYVGCEPSDAYWGRYCRQAAAGGGRHGSSPAGHALLELGQVLEEGRQLVLMLRRPGVWQLAEGLGP